MEYVCVNYDFSSPIKRMAHFIKIEVLNWTFIRVDIFTGWNGNDDFVEFFLLLNTGWSLIVMQSSWEEGIIFMVNLSIQYLFVCPMNWDDSVRYP